MTAELILVVCTANVCRSPLAEFLMRADLGRPGIRVESAGTHAHDGDTVCSLVAGFRVTDEWEEAASAHHARLITPELLNEADVILTASREIRGEIVRLDPAVRDRTHTLLEAAHRGALFAPREEDGVVAEYAAHLDRSRSSMGPVPAIRKFWRPVRGSDDVVSITDRHGSGSRVHARTLHQVEDVTAAIVEQLMRMPQA